MKTMFAGVAIATLVGTTAFADFYIIQDSTKRCRIVEEGLGLGSGIAIGQRGVGVRPNAEITC